MKSRFLSEYQPNTRSILIRIKKNLRLIRMPMLNIQTKDCFFFIRISWFFFFGRMDKTLFSFFFCFNKYNAVIK